MATHIDVLCGLYKNAVDGNSQAIVADRKYLAREGANNFCALYRCHNFHFKLYGAMLLGQLQPAPAELRPRQTIGVGGPAQRRQSRAGQIKQTYALTAIIANDKRVIASSHQITGELYH